MEARKRGERPPHWDAPGFAGGAVTNSVNSAPREGMKSHIAAEWGDTVTKVAGAAPRETTRMAQG